MKDISFPVGLIQMMNMHPMNFYEFLIATGKDKAASIIASKPEILPDTIHEMLLNNLRQYMFTGGMPECVKIRSDRLHRHPFPWKLRVEHPEN